MSPTDCVLTQSKVGDTGEPNIADVKVRLGLLPPGDSMIGDSTP